MTDYDIPDFNQEERESEKEMIADMKAEERFELRWDETPADAYGEDYENYLRTQYLDKSDIEWLRRKLRSEFDINNALWQHEYRLELIERAKRFGQFDLAREMEADL